MKKELEDLKTAVESRLKELEAKSEAKLDEFQKVAKNELRVR